MESDTSKENPPKENFEMCLKRLEQIIMELERGELPLETSVARFEEGTARLKACNAILEGMEKKIALLSKREDGSVQEVPFQMDQAKNMKKN